VQRGPTVTPKKESFAGSTRLGRNGKTPAEEANIDLKLGKNKWLSLIKRMEGSQLFSLSGSL